LSLTITCGVIAAILNPFDIGAVDVQDRMAHLHVSQENHMPTFQIYTIASAPEKAKPALEQLQQAFGFLPNLAASIANSPKLVTALVGVFQQVHNSSLTEPEIQIVLLTDAVANSSAYSVAFHTALAVQQGVNPEVTDAIRENTRGRTICGAFHAGEGAHREAGASQRTGTQCIPRRRLYKRTDHGGHRHSRGLDDHQLCWNHRQAAAVRPVPAIRLARIRMEARGPGNAIIGLRRPIQF
jgi:hypothetical protein